MAKRTDKIRHPKKRAFLAAMAEVGNITRAAELADVARSQHYVWITEDPAYVEAFAAAEEEAADRLETEARRRAVQGVEEPVWQMGKYMGTIQKYSDTLLIFLLKGARPEKYKDRTSTELKGALSHDHRHAHTLDLSKLTDEELELAERLALRATGDPAGASDT